MEIPSEEATRNRVGRHDSQRRDPRVSRRRGARGGTRD
jgi:hypothetical protein